MGRGTTKQYLLDKNESMNSLQLFLLPQDLHKIWPINNPPRKEEDCKRLPVRLIRIEEESYFPQ